MAGVGRTGQPHPVGQADSSKGQVLTLTLGVGSLAHPLPTSVLPTYIRGEGVVAKLPGGWKMPCRRAT